MNIPEEDELVGEFGDEFPYFEDSVDYDSQLSYLRTLDDENRTSLTDELGEYSYNALPATDASLSALQSLHHNGKEDPQNHTREDGGNTTSNDKAEHGSPAKFVQALYDILEDPKNEDIISWEGEDGFVIKKHDAFTELLLPYLCNSVTLCSFIRQLNGYGFSKSDPRRSYFKHPVFRKGRPDLLKYIKRRRSTKRKTKTKESGSQNHDGASTAHGKDGSNKEQEPKEDAQIRQKKGDPQPSVRHSADSSGINALSAAASALSQMISFCILQANEMPTLSSRESEVHWRYIEEVHDSSLRFLQSVGVSVPHRNGKLKSLETLLELLREYDSQYKAHSVATSEPTSVSESSPSHNVAGD